MLKAVCNSSPLIHLSKIGRLHLLRDLFQEILVPEEVFEDTDLKRALMLMLDEGEAASIVLALERKADLIILDDYDGRVVAKEYRLNVTGTIGILLKAKLSGNISSLRHELDSLKDSGFWLSEELYQRALEESGEQKEKS